MKTQKLKVYEAPKAEVIEMEAQGVLCASGPVNGFSDGTGVQFGSHSVGW